MNIIYYECHITIDSFNDEEQRRFVTDLVAKNGFRVVDYNVKDAIMSARDVSFIELNNRADQTLKELQKYGINIRRCKIEGIIRDDRWDYVL